jgi:hypothetical protein
MQKKVINTTSRKPNYRGITFTEARLYSDIQRYHINYE